MARRNIFLVVLLSTAMFGCKVTMQQANENFDLGLLLGVEDM